MHQMFFGSNAFRGVQYDGEPVLARIPGGPGCPIVTCLSKLRTDEIGYRTTRESTRASSNDVFMTTTANASPNAVGEHRKHLGVGRFVRGKRSPKSLMKPTVTTYQLTDRLRDGHAVDVSADEIVTTVSGWLAELGAASPLVEDLAQAVRAGDWPKAHSLGDYLSVEVARAELLTGYRQTVQAATTSRDQRE